MTVLSALKRLILFWYPNGLVVWLRIWRNSLLLLEEDLAVGLMIKLLFVPLFHDSSPIGRVMSFTFRVLRIILGLLAFALASLLILGLAVLWFGLPALAVVVSANPGSVFKLLFLSGILLFVHQWLSYPLRKLWKVKNLSELWQASYLKRSQAALSSLLQNYRVKLLLSYVEQTADSFVTLSQAEETVIYQKVWDLGKELGVNYLQAEHFFVGLLQSVPNIENLLMQYGLAPEDFKSALDYLNLKDGGNRAIWIWDEEFQIRHLKGVNRGWLGTPTPSLDLVAEDLTKKAAAEKIPDFVGRSDIVAQIVNILSQQSGRNVIIVGEAGAGRTTLINYLAKKIVTGDAPETLATKRLVKLDLLRLISGMRSEGELAERIKEIFDEIKFSGNIVVFIDEIQTLGIGDVATEFNVYSLLLPFIESEQFQFIGATDQSGFARTLGKNSSFARLFAKVDLPPATALETIKILKERAIETENAQKVKTSIPAINTLVNLAGQYIHDRVLPDSAIQLFRSCLPLAKNGWITKAVIEEIVGTQVHVPTGELAKEQRDQLLNLDTIIHQQFVNQEEAVADVANALKRSAANLQDRGRPLGTFLFVGPTGVGKTELAKVLNSVYFAGSGQFLRFDMSEFQGPEALNKMVGTNAEEGQLTGKVHFNPYSLILLDEFEKADPKILTLFLQVLDDGRLTDGSGRLIDFTNTIIIATSNAGSLLIVEAIKAGKGLEEIKKEIAEELLKVFRPELVNRFDEVVIFKPLSEEYLKEIVKLKLAQLQNKLKAQGLLISFADDLVTALAQKGFDPLMGARPLRRLIQDTIETKLSELILQNKLPKGQPFQIDSRSIFPEVSI